MDYIGSKIKLNDWIFGIIRKKVSQLYLYTFIDGCAGSGATSKYALERGMNIVANDLMFFPSVIVNGSRIKSANDLATLQKHIQIINGLPGEDGFFFKNYSESSGRKYFTDDNAKKIDACRKYIDGVKETQIRNNLLYFGLEALSRVSNVAGVHGAFLKQFKERALQPFALRVEKRLVYSDKGIITFNEDVVSLLKRGGIGEAKSILYIDPPYNSRQYPPNYHLYETFAKNDSPRIAGKTGYRENWVNESKSDLCNKAGLLKAFREIVTYSPTNLIYFSYSSDGLVSETEIKEQLSDIADIKIHKKATKRFKADTSPNRKYNDEKLSEWLIEVIRHG